MDWIKCFKEYDRVYRVHALRRMFERNITFDEINEIVDRVEVIEEYIEDIPYPSCLILGFTRANRPIHIVCSINHEEKTVIIITIYIPEKNKWENDFRRRVT
jgi:hypothetical protein